MESKRDIVIVSCFGRGNWLAAELAQSDFKVTLVDVSEHMGRWTPEDWEGPFGFFHPPKLDHSQVARLSEEDYFDSVNEGFCLWLKDGPYDFKGTHSTHLLEGLGIDNDTVEYLKNAPLGMTESVKEHFAKSYKKDFDQNWVGHLAHNLASNIYYTNYESLNSSSALPIFESLSVRRVSRRGAERSLQWVADKGADVFSKAKIKDMQFLSGKFQNLEIESEWSGVIKADSLIWMLSSEETEMCSEKARELLYPKGVLRPDWIWLRFRYRFSQDDNLMYLPLKFVMIEDIHLPWTHSNLSFVQKTVTANDYDVWMRIPEKQRFHRDYLRKLSQDVLDIFERRIPGLKADCLEMPQDFMYDFNELGPARFPVFSEAELQEKKPIKCSNVYIEQPEVWSRMDWTGQFQSQAKVLSKIYEQKSKGRGVNL